VMGKAVPSSAEKPVSGASVPLASTTLAREQREAVSRRRESKRPVVSRRGHCPPSAQDRREALCSLLERDALCHNAHASADIVPACHCELDCRPGGPRDQQEGKLGEAGAGPIGGRNGGWSGRPPRRTRAEPHLRALPTAARNARAGLRHQSENVTELPAGCAAPSLWPLPGLESGQRVRASK
jgi:hypothetical protein